MTDDLLGLGLEGRELGHAAARGIAFVARRGVGHLEIVAAGDHPEINVHDIVAVDRFEVAAGEVDGLAIFFKHAHRIMDFVQL